MIGIFHVSCINHQYLILVTFRRYASFFSYLLSTTAKAKASLIILLFPCRKSGRARMAFFKVNFVRRLVNFYSSRHSTEI